MESKNPFAKQLKHFLDSSNPAFAGQRLEHLDGGLLQATHNEVPVSTEGTVDLREVVGTTHPDYYGLTWQELLGNPEAPESSLMKRMRRALRELEVNPEYYTSRERKEHWSFTRVGAAYYVTEGMHRTVVGRFLLESHSLPPIVHGVAVSAMQPKATHADGDCGTQEAPRVAWWRRLLGLA